jgi:uncharacterized protein YidB (DUF937 family)
MSIFDSVKGMVEGEIGSQLGGDSGLMGHAMQLVNDPDNGGLDGLVQQFRDKGLGDVVDSWIGPGGNHPITAEQVQQVIGQDRLNEIASKFGMSADDVSAKMAELLPSVVDKLTPGGAVASGN